MAIQNFRIKNGVELGVGNTFLVREAPQRVAITTAGTVVLDTIDFSTYRSASYTAQIRTQNQLSNSSIGSTNFGNGYVPGTYTDVELVAQTGVGTGAKSTIGIVTEQSITLSSIRGKVFRTNDDISGISSGSALIFSDQLVVSPADNSKAKFVLSNVGTGYTVFPEITVSSPVISGNTVDGVIAGSPAVIDIDALKFNQIVISSGNTVTSKPSITIPAPGSGVGTRAQGIISFGLGIGTYPVAYVDNEGIRRGNLSISVASTTGSGAGIGFSAKLGGLIQHNYPTDPDGDPANPGGINTTRNYTPPLVGMNYTPADFPVSITDTSGSPSVAATFRHVSFCLPDINYQSANIAFPISNYGSGYTSPPTITVDNPSIGTNVGILTATLGIGTITLIHGGSGYKRSPELLGAPVGLVGYALTVGLGLTLTGIKIAAGSGYNVGVTTLTVTGVNNIGSGASLSVSSYNSDGGIESVNIVNAGAGYTVLPTVTIQNSSGGSNGQISITDMSVTSINLSLRGSGAVSGEDNILFFSLPEIGDDRATIDSSFGVGQITFGRTSQGLAGVGSGYLAIPGITITGGGGSGAAATVSSLGISSECIEISNPGSGYSVDTVATINIAPPAAGGSTGPFVYPLYKFDSITITSPGAGYTSQEVNIKGTFNDAWAKVYGPIGGIATVTNMNANGVRLTNVGAGYTTGDLPITISYGSPSPGGITSSYFSVDSFSYHPGVGYTVAPTVTSSLPFVGSGSSVTFTSTINNYSTSDYYLKTGPGYGGTSVYYIQPQNKFEFYITTDSEGTLFVPNEYKISTTINNVHIGGIATSITITDPGSSFQVGDIVAISTSPLSAYSTLTGAGVSFIVSNIYTNYQISDLTLLHSVGAASSDAYVIEHSGLDNDVDLGTFSADIDGSNIRLKLNANYNDTDIIYLKTHLSEF